MGVRFGLPEQVGEPWSEDGAYPNPTAACIYCGSRQYSAAEPTRRLGDEHIVPESLGGRSVIRAASCQACEAVTSGFESRFVRSWTGLAKPALGFKGRKSRRTARKVEFFSRDDKAAPFEMRSLPRDMVPEALVLPSFKYPPAWLFNDASQDLILDGVSMRPLAPDFGGKLKRYKREIGLAKFTINDVARTLFKIAFSATLTQVTRASLRPFILDAILEDAPRFNFMGTPGAELVGQGRHIVTINRVTVSNSAPFIDVRIRLFSDLDMPTYQVIVGELIL